MFEKEAEEYTKQFIKTHSESDKFINCKRETDNYNVILAQGYELGFQKGAEFGYNKANEWHKDLPTKDINLVIIEVEDCGYLLCEYRDSVWYDKGSSAECKEWITRNIKRWKEIVLPKESK